MTVSAKPQALLARLMLSVALVASALIATAVDWNHSHLFHPDWHPHARFHGTLFILLTDAMCALALWLLWRRGAEQRLPFQVGLWVMLALWLPFFFVESLVPGSSVRSHPTDPRYTLLGLELAINQWIALVLAVWSSAAYWLAVKRLEADA